MLSLVSLCSAVFQSSIPLQMKFFEHIPIQSRSTFEYQKCVQLCHGVSGKLWEFLGPWCLSWEFLFPTARIWPPVPNSSTRDKLSFWFQVGYQVAPNPALVCTLESWILVVLGWAHHIRSSRILHCLSRTFVPIEFFVVHVLLVRTSLWIRI
jgi:hypothetical protein